MTQENLVKNANKEVVQNIKMQLFEDPKAHLKYYILVMQKIEKKNMLWVSKMELLPKTLVLTHNSIALAHEDFKYPPLVETTSLPTQFSPTVSTVFHMEDVASVRLAEDPHEFKIVFDDNSQSCKEKGVSFWTLLVDDPQEKERLLQVLSDVWETHFQVPLPVDPN